MEVTPLAFHPNFPKVAEIKAERGYMGFDVPLPTTFRAFLPVYDESPLKDRGEAHITVIDPKEFRKLAKNHPQIAKRLFRISTHSLRYVGIGSIEEKDNRTYFVVVDWPAGNRLRKALGLPEKDFHVTVAFREADIHTARKDRETILPGFRASTILRALNGRH